MTEIFEVHGVKFTREGICNMCGGCDHECSACLHGKYNKKLLRWECVIHDTLLDVCRECTTNPSSKWYNEGKEVTHKICYDFPSHPWLHVVKKGICAYKFQRVDDLGTAISTPFPFTGEDDPELK